MPHSPKVAVLMHPSTFNALRLAGAARGVCELIWALDLGEDHMAPLGKVLTRFGQVVDIGGMGADEAAEELRRRHAAGIVTFEDERLMASSRIADRLSLPFHRPEVAWRLVNKFAQRQALHEAGIEVPRFWPLSGGLDLPALRSLAAEISYPAVLKPQQGSGSRQVHSVADAGALVALVEQLWAQPAPDLAEDLIVEEYLPDSDSQHQRGIAEVVSVESLVSHGRISHVATTGRFAMAEPYRECGSFVPSQLADSVAGSVTEVATDALRALGVQTGCTHTELKVTPDGLRIVEVNGRMGGNVAELVDMAGGPSLLAAALRLALGENVIVDGPVRFDRVSYCYWMQAPTAAARLSSLDGLDDVAAIGGVQRVSMNRRPGDRLDWREGSWGHLFSVFGTVAGHDQLARIPTAIAERVSIGYDAKGGS